MVKEYSRFGDSVLQREAGSADDWEPVPMDDVTEATAAMEAAEAQRGQPTPAAELIKVKRAGDADFQPWQPG